MVRFTTHNVARMRNALVKHCPESRQDAFLRTALQIGGDIGHGTRYIGMGGRMFAVEYGPKGARKAVAYLYGIGDQMGIWDRMREKADAGDNEAYAELRHAFDMVGSVGQKIIDEWSGEGMYYARRFASWVEAA